MADTGKHAPRPWARAPIRVAYRLLERARDVALEPADDDMTWLQHTRQMGSGDGSTSP